MSLAPGILGAIERSRPTLVDGPVADEDPPNSTLPVPTDPPMLMLPPPMEVGLKLTVGLEFWEVLVVPPDICDEIKILIITPYNNRCF